MERTDVGVAPLDADEGLGGGLLQKTSHFPYVGGTEQRKEWARGADLSCLFEEMSHARLALSIGLARRRGAALLDQKLEVLLRPEVPKRVRIGHRVPTTLLVRNVGIYEKDRSFALVCPPQRFRKRVSRNRDPDESLFTSSLGDDKRDLGQTTDGLENDLGERGR